MPAFAPTHNAPVTPPAGPDISSDTGCSSAFSELINPPSERSRLMRPSILTSRSLVRRLRT